MMNKLIHLDIDGEKFFCDLDQALDISIPLKEGDNNPNCFQAESPRFEVIRDGEFIGSVAEGGSVNYKRLIITPHGNGTHTECYGHINADTEATITKQIKTFFAYALVITVRATEKEGDLIITGDLFPENIPDWVDALVVRTVPNTIAKPSRNYSGTNPAYFDKSFMDLVVEHNIIHFLTDLPSVDREVDGGALRSHKSFWNGNTRRSCTITEMVFVNNRISDGIYLLNLQVPNIDMDAAPSRPVLFAMTKV